MPLLEYVAPDGYEASKTGEAKGGKPVTTKQ